MGPGSAVSGFGGQRGEGSVPAVRIFCCFVSELLQHAWLPPRPRARKGRIPWSALAPRRLPGRNSWTSTAPLPPTLL